MKRYNGCVLRYVLTFVYVEFVYHCCHTPSIIYQFFAKKPVQPQHISECLPVYLFKQLRNGSYGRNVWSPYKPLLVAAYDYQNYIVVTMDGDGLSGKQIYCRYFDDHFYEILPSVQSVIYPPFAIHCCSRENATYISFSIKPEESIDAYVPLFQRRHHNPRYFLSLCLAPLYGDESKWLMLAEVIEHYKLQKVDHFYLYIKDNDAYLFKLVKNYIESGEAEVINLRTTRDRPGEEWQALGIQDCLQRSRYHSEYAMFSDLDERITPLIEGVTLRDYVGQVMVNHAAMCFQPRRILRTSAVPQRYEAGIYLGTTTLLENLPTLIFTNSTAISPPGTLDKCIINPTMVFIMDVHNVAVFLRGDGRTYRVPPEHALNRHYRDINVGGWSRNRTIFNDFAPYSKTIYPHTLMPALFENVRQRLDQVYLDH